MAIQKYYIRKDNLICTNFNPEENDYLPNFNNQENTVAWIELACEFVECNPYIG